MAFVLPPPRSRRNLGTNPIWLPVGFRGRGLPGSGGNCDLTNNSCTDFTVWQAPSFGALTAIRLVYGGYDISNLGPVDRGVTVTGYASLWMPAAASFSWAVASNVASGSTVIPMTVAPTSPANQVTAGMAASGAGIATGSYVVSAAPTYSTAMNLTAYNITLNLATTAALTNASSLTFAGLCTPATWGQSRQVTLFPRKDFYVSDPIPCHVAANGMFGIRGSWTFSATQIALASYPAEASGSTRLSIGSFNEGNSRGTNLADMTLASLGVSNSGGGFWPPVAILGLVNDTNPHPSVVIVGDSIAAGTGDLADSNGRMGYIQRSLSNSIPWTSVARGSTSAVQNFQDIRAIQRLVSLTSATDVILEHCRNDLANGVTAANTVSYLQAMAAPLADMGCRTWVCTCPPIPTSSSDGWTTPGNQVASTYEGQRTTFNSNVRTNYASLGFSGVIDVAGVVEDGGNPGKWKTSNGAWTADGVHPNSTNGHPALISAGVVNAGMFPVL